MDAATDPALGSRSRLALTLALILTGAMLIAFAVAAPKLASAAFPGRNGLIAFERDQTGRHGAFLMHVFTVAPDGSRLHELAVGGEPSFSPDGKRIAFALGGPGIREMNADGSHVHVVTHPPSYHPGSNGFYCYDYYPAFSPNGNRIVFDRECDTQEGNLSTFQYNDIFMVNADGSHLRRLTNSRRFLKSNLVFSPDGRSIAFTSQNRGSTTGSEIIAMNAAGSHQRQLTHGGGGNASPDYSPDGKQIVYIHNSGVWLMNTDGSKPRQLTQPSAAYETPAFSPDGQEVVCAQQTSFSGQYYKFDLFVMNADGSNTSQLTHSPKSLSSLPSWQPLR